MAASRASSLRALNLLAAGGKQQARSLHMTGPATFSSLLTTERRAINLPRDLAGLRAECQKRNLPTTGSKAELTDRLSAHETVNSRAYSTRQPSRPSLPTASLAPATTLPTRHFNTSRALKAVNDTSTIDFAYLPTDFNPDTDAPPTALRVPLLPAESYSNTPSDSVPTYAAIEAEDVVMRPEIITISADGTHINAPSAMSEVSDNATVDFHGMAETVAASAKKFGQAAPVEEGSGMVSQVWGGLIDDIFGPKGAAGGKAA